MSFMSFMSGVRRENKGELIAPWGRGEHDDGMDSVKFRSYGEGDQEGKQELFEHEYENTGDDKSVS